MTEKKRNNVTHKTIGQSGLNRKVQIDFSPSLNGTYRIKFPKEYSSAGFTVLLKGGMFHRFPDGFVVTKKHTELLDEEKVPYSFVKD